MIIIKLGINLATYCEKSKKSFFINQSKETLLEFDLPITIGNFMNRFLCKYKVSVRRLKKFLTIS